jgi:hypothetical protein
MHSKDQDSARIAEFTIDSFGQDERVFVGDSATAAQIAHLGEAVKTVADNIVGRLNDLIAQLDDIAARRSHAKHAPATCCACCPARRTAVSEKEVGRHAA